MISCKNCNNEFDSEFCPKCGHPAKLERIDRYYVLDQIQNSINFEKGFFYTIKELFIRPGESIQEFILRDRQKHIKPFVFLVLTSIIITVLSYSFDFTLYQLNTDKGTIFENMSNLGKLREWLNNNIGYTYFIIGCFAAFWTRILYRKSNYNTYEIIVALCFIFGEMTLIMSLSILIGELISFWISTLGILISFLYPIWALGQFFGKKKIVNYIKSILVLLLGIISYLTFFTLIGYFSKILLSA